MPCWITTRVQFQKMHFFFLGKLRETKICNCFARSNIRLSHGRYICDIHYNDKIHHTLKLLQVSIPAYHLLISICRTLEQCL